MNTWGTDLLQLKLEKGILESLNNEIGIQTIEGLISLAQFPYGYKALLRLVQDDAENLEQILSKASNFLNPEILEEIKANHSIDRPLGALLENDKVKDKEDNK